jgi:glycosyltransferase involved in cell wall biosynthesis
VEALSCGRPVVASDVGGIPELVSSASGILTPPRNPVRLAEALTEAFCRTWDEPGIAAEFGRSWDQVAEETYQTCLAVHEAARKQT